MSVKMTFSLDDETAVALERTARRLGLPKSRVVREAILELAARRDRLGELERQRLLATFDDVIGRIPVGSVEAVDAELADLRRSRSQDVRQGERP